ncbi:hypothetical protein SRHO_G00025410 [Serrasalmus rhombeus]
MNVFDARQYCRRYHADLASIRNATENQQILNLTAGQVVWIGLYRTRLWSDQSNSTYENWLTGQPDNLNYVEHCTAASLGNSGQWTDENCNRTLPFFCYREISAVKTEDSAVCAALELKGNEILCTALHPGWVCMDTEGQQMSREPYF